MQNNDANFISVPSVYDAIKNAFRAFNDILGHDIRNKWNKMDMRVRNDAIVAISVIGRLAQNPEKYFSRATTEGAWHDRANKYADINGMKNKSDAFRMVPGPKDVVYAKVKGAFFENPALASDFYKFCDYVQKWEYNRTNPWNYKYQTSYEMMIKRYQDFIITKSADLVCVADVINTNHKKNPMVLASNKLAQLIRSGRQHQ